MNYGSLLQVYKDQNLFICSNCENGCRYLGVPFPNYCSRCGTLFTSISITNYVQPEEPDEDDYEIKETWWQRFKNKVKQYVKQIIRESENLNHE